MVWLSSGSSFTKRNGSSSGTAAQDFNPEDVGLAFANGWQLMSQSTFPGLSDIPQYGVANPLGRVAQFKLAQTAVPFVYLGTCNIGNNGALTSAPGLPATYSNGCYVLVATNGIAAGTPTAPTWYFCIMSSATAGTIYNNVYTSGDPLVYTASTASAFATTGPGSVTGLTAAQTGPNWTLPANMMGPNGVLEIAAVYGCQGSTNSKTCAVKLGSATIYTQATTTATNVACLALLTCQNQGVTGAQVSNQTGTLGFSATAQTYSTQDTTTNLTLAMSATKVAAESVVFDSFSATVTPG
jgi:hypothetical protein